MFDVHTQWRRTRGIGWWVTGGPRGRIAVPELSAAASKRGQSTRTTAPEGTPLNMRRGLRRARGTQGFAGVTSHVFRKTAATILDEAGLSARMVADQLGHLRPSLTQDVYLGRKAIGREAADALEIAFDTGSE